MNQEIKNEIYDDNFTGSKNEVLSYQETNTLSFLTELKNREKIKKSEIYIPTGFPQLDKVLEGGICEGLYICGAIPSLGKTTFMLQMCDQIAASGRDVMIISLEMSKIELATKSISRHTAINSIRKYKSTLASKITKDVLAQLEYDDGSEDEIIDNAIKDYFSYADHVYIFEGVGDIGVKQIREMIKNHINITGKSEVHILKNRNGESGIMYNYDYYAKYNLFCNYFF